MFAERMDVVRYMVEHDGHATCREIEYACDLRMMPCMNALGRLKANGTIRRLRGIGPWARWALTVPLDPFGQGRPRPLQL